MNEHKFNVMITSAIFNHWQLNIHACTNKGKHVSTSSDTSLFSLSFFKRDVEIPPTLTCYGGRLAVISLTMKGEGNKGATVRHKSYVTAWGRSSLGYTMSRNFYLWVYRNLLDTCWRLLYAPQILSGQCLDDDTHRLSLQHKEFFISWGKEKIMVCKQLVLPLLAHLINLESL